ncbi:MAG: HAD family phosphatase [Sulfuricellaceae bacterium]
MTGTNNVSIEAIIFDCEGVIIDTETIWDKGQEEFLRRRGFVYDRSRIKHLLTGTSMQDGVMVLQKEYGFLGNIEAQAEERIAIVRDLFSSEVEFIPGFLEFFLKANQIYKTSIATAMPSELLNLVDRRLHLSELFSGLVFTLADVNFRAKPNPDLFEYAAKKMEIPTNRCLVIEDAPHGIEAARKAGMKSIALATTYERTMLINSGADWIANSFAEITSLLLHQRGKP